MIDIGIIELGVAALAVGVAAYLGAKYGVGIYDKAIAVASDVEGLVAEVEAGFPDEKGTIYTNAKKFVADFKDMLADGKIDFFEARRQFKDGEAIYCDLLDMIARLKGAE
jgi:Na+/H+-translocating membrane pyrophosphatase